MQISNQPTTLQQITAFRHAHMTKKTCWRHSFGDRWSGWMVGSELGLKQHKNTDPFCLDGSDWCWCEFTLLRWPEESTDFNPLEHLWEVLKILIMDVQQQICKVYLLKSGQWIRLFSSVNPVVWLKHQSTWLDAHKSDLHRLLTKSSDLLACWWGFYTGWVC